MPQPGTAWLGVFYCSALARQEKSDHTRLFSALYERTSETRIQKRRVQATRLLNEKKRSTKRTAELAAGRQGLRKDTANELLSSSAAERSPVEREQWRGREAERDAELRKEKEKSFGSTKAGCREPDHGLITAKGVKKL